MAQSTNLFYAPGHVTSGHFFICKGAHKCIGLVVLFREKSMYSDPIVSATSPLNDARFFETPDYRAFHNRPPTTSEVNCEV